jgi:hypothetical protein
MANYLIKSCDELTEIVVDSGENTINVGDIYFVAFTGETTPSCFSVVSLSEDPIGEGILSATTYSSCLQCAQENNLSIIVVSCNDPGLFGPVNANQFNEWPIGFTYKLCPPPEFEFSECICFSAVTLSNDFIPVTFDISGPFLDCNCVEFPRSANTESLVCVETCTGGTFTQIVPPHPVWTDGLGNTIIQMNAITLGGPDGLNA